MVTGWEAVDDAFIGVILLYYGALWLGNAVALSGLSRLTLEGRTAAHGLSVVIPSHASERRPFVTARLETGNDQLAFAIINLAFGGESLTGRSGTIKELLQAIPEMASSLTELGIDSCTTEIAPLWSTEGQTRYPRT